MQTEPGEFYCGGVIDPESGQRGKPFVYPADALVTHGVIVGMTGSGKTGLGVGLLEEALLSGIPCLVIDPKGDMGNLRLIFPDLEPSDFAPWVDPAEAERRGVSVDQLATETATTWRQGLESWDIGSERMRRVVDGAEATIYTPGSSAGVPIAVLGSLAAPPLSWDDHTETLRDEIEGYVSSLLVLAGVSADPVSSPSHILLSTIIETEWRHGRDLDLARLVGMIPQPPLRKLGVFEIEDFYPKKERTALALKLNGLLASPSFASWLEGEPLDIDRLLTGGERTRAPIIYLAHLTESQRQFVVTLLLSKLITWMRRQPGTSKLRTLVYMDEVFGFAPPVAEPPAKKQILTILKQARAYGVGMVLSTQNPVDLDYKAMSNAGTWLIGRLQTENDKRRVLEGLTDAGGATDISAVDTLVSNLDQRQFVLRRAGRPEPTLFGTRWVMSYLAGPLDRTRVEMLTPKSSAAPSPEAREPSTATAADDAVAVAPDVADGVEVFTLDPAAPWADAVGAVPLGGRHRPVAATVVHLLYDDRRAGVHHREDYEAVIDPLDSRFDPDSILSVDHDDRDFRPGPPTEGEFVLPHAPIRERAFWKDLGNSLRDHLVRERNLTIWKNPALSLYSRLEESEEDFRRRCADAAAGAADADLAKLRDRYSTKIDRVRSQISRSDRRVAELEADVAARKQQEVMSGIGDLVGSLIGGRSKSGALRRASTRRSQTRRTTADLETALAKLGDEQRQLVELELELEQEVNRILGHWDAKADQLETVDIPLESSDVKIDDLRLVWVPTD